MKGVWRNLKLEADLAAYAAQLDQTIEAVVRAVVLELLRRIVERTPVDKGRASGSWSVTFGTPGDWPGLPENFEGDGKSISLESIGQVSFSSYDGIYWIFNNLPYIHVLEFGLYPGDGPKTIAGFSIQAPSGMVRIALAEIETEIFDILSRAANGAK